MFEELCIKIQNRWDHCELNLSEEGWIEVGSKVGLEKYKIFAAVEAWKTAWERKRNHLPNRGIERKANISYQERTVQFITEKNVMWILGKSDASYSSRFSCLAPFPYIIWSPLCYALISPCQFIQQSTCNSL